MPLPLRLCPLSNASDNYLKIEQLLIVLYHSVKVLNLTWFILAKGKFFFFLVRLFLSYSAVKLAAQREFDNYECKQKCIYALVYKDVVHHSASSL